MRRGNSLKVCAVILICLISGISTMTLAQSYDITYIDPEGDIVLMVDDGSFVPAPGHQNIDILEISSSQQILGLPIVLKMMVKGTILDQENITYGFNILDEDSLFYFIIYTNGICSGYGFENSDADVLLASGSGTDTLEIDLPASNVEEIQNFDIVGWTAEEVNIDEESSNIFQDVVPDDADFFSGLFPIEAKPLIITDPKHGSTLSGTYTIKGITNNESISSVEVQLDSEDWNYATSIDDWQRWDFQLDTTAMGEGIHTITARAFNGTDYYYDSINIIVDQSNAVSPPILESLSLSVGDEFVYSTSDLNISEVPFLGDISMGNTFTVTGTEDLEVDGQTLEVFVIDITGEVEGGITNILNDYSIESKRWQRQSDLAEVKNEAEVSGSVSIFGYSISLYTFTETSFDPPYDRLEFPISIGEKWLSTTTSTTHFITDIKVPFTDDIHEDNTSTSNILAHYEALHVENITVPAGTFETFVLWSLSQSTTDSGDGQSTGYEWGDYTLEYYSPELGFPIKIEQYNSNRELVLSMELESYRHRTDLDDQDISLPSGYQLPIWILYIIILAMLIVLISILVVKRYREKAFIKQYLKGLETEDKSQTESKVVSPSQASTMEEAPSGSTKETEEEASTQSITCPKCKNVFKVQKVKGWAVTVNCPYCGTRGRIV